MWLWCGGTLFGTMPCGWWVDGLLETWVRANKQPPFITVPEAKSSWTLITSASLSYIYFLTLPSKKAVGFLNTNDKIQFQDVTHTNTCITYTHTRVQMQSSCRIHERLTPGHPVDMEVSVHSSSLYKQACYFNITCAYLLRYFKSSNLLMIANAM